MNLPNNRALQLLDLTAVSYIHLTLPTTSRGAKAGARLGGGGPDYTVEAEINADRIHLKGALAAARKGDRVNPEKRSSGSQFYIVDGKEVVEQMLSTIEIRNGISYSPDQKEAYLAKGGTPFLDGCLLYTSDAADD